MTENIKVLLIEDDEDDYIIAKDLLSEVKSKNFSIQWVSNYEEGLNEIISNKYDVCLIDYKLSEGDGIELIKRATEHDIHMPLILLTGANDTEIDYQAMKAGASDYLVKGQISSQLLERSIRYSILQKQSELEINNFNKYLGKKVDQRTKELRSSINRLNKLQVITSELSEAVTQKDISNIVISRLMEFLSADACLVYTFNGSALELITYKGYEDKVIQNYVSLSLDDLSPITDAFNTGTIIELADLFQKQNKYPHLYKNYKGTSIAIPLIVEGRKIGVIEFDFKTSINKKISKEDLNFVFAVCLQSAQSLERARLYDALITSQNEIKKSLDEKEVLLKEIHHRVKNNLQVISSLLNLQSNRINDEKAKSIFKISQDRIKSIALVHESLYKSNDYSLINFEEYINRLINNLQYSYGAEVRNIKFDIKVKSSFITINIAIPCGLIINELISNIFKYAFTDETEDPMINVDFHRIKDNYHLKISDNGTGLNKDFNINDVKSLGLKLVTILVDQLGGKLYINSKNPTFFEIVFPAQ